SRSLSPATMPLSARPASPLSPSGMWSRRMGTPKSVTGWDRARFYEIDGHRLPSVTTILDIIAKPALGPWYAKEERRQLETALLDVLVLPGPPDREAYKAFVLAQLATAITGVKAADRAREQAAAIGTAVHAGIE